VYGPLKLLQFIKALTLLKDIVKLTSVSKMDEILEAAILGAVYDDDIEEAVHHFISNLFRSNRTQTFLNCQTVDI
jgi:dsRNA-specific ribonuclease